MLTSAPLPSHLVAATHAPDYVAYLHPLCNATRIAGDLLRKDGRIWPAAVKSAALTASSHRSIMVRAAAAQDIVAFLGILKPKDRPECL